MSYQLVWEPRGAYKSFHGFVTSHEFTASIAAFQGDARFDDAHYSINDFSDVAGHNITEGDVHRFAAFAVGAFRSNRRIRIAVVTTDAGIHRLVELYASPGLAPFPLGIFATLEEARTWVELPA